MDVNAVRCRAIRSNWAVIDRPFYVVALVNLNFCLLLFLPPIYMNSPFPAAMDGPILNRDGRLPTLAWFQEADLVVGHLLSVPV